MALDQSALLEFLHTHTLHRTQRLIRLRVSPPIGIHPGPQRSIMDPQLPGDLSDRLPGLDHHLHRLSLDTHLSTPSVR